MFFSKAIAAAALALATAVSAATPIAFTSVPGPFTIGKPANITWSGGDGVSGVTISLLKGSSPESLTAIGFITTGLTGRNYFTWTPSSALVPADDFALEIQQGLDDSNYSGMFTIQAAQSQQATTIYAAGGGSTVAISTVTPNATTTIMLGTGTAASASMGTGIPMSRNVTMSSATLTATTTSSATITSTATTGAASSSSTGNAASRTNGVAGLGLGAVVAAVAYLL